MTWRRDHLPQTAAQLASRPGHETVRVLVADVLRYGLHANLDELGQEVQAPDIGGRLDTLFGATVFEYKSDLRRERGDVAGRLPDYLSDRERKTGRRFLGIATDGRTWEAYELRDGKLAPLGKPLDLDPARSAEALGSALLAWLEPALADRDDLPPEPRAVQRALGRDSFAFSHARATLSDLWETLRRHPEVALKRQLWDGLLREVYGQPVGNDALFLQHTYLTVVAKTIAARALQQETDSAEAILSGALLEQEGIYGAVEGGFFDWVLLDPRGAALVLQVARQAARFRLRDVQADVLKALYESLIDPDQRHDLGEYYTPDWLATKLVRAAVARPLDDRVLDPACGSGTFLFHAVRHLLDAAKAAGLPDAEAVRRCAEKVRGLDVHPVAVIIARVTWLLALGPAVAARPAALYVPVFLGNAMQWNVGVANEVRVRVPDEPPLIIPAGFAESEARFDPGVQALADGLRDEAAAEAVESRLKRIEGASRADVAAMTATYARMLALRKADRDGIWPFVMRNLVRPRWLSMPAQRADVVLGNPPWVAYRYLRACLSASFAPRSHLSLEITSTRLAGRGGEEMWTKAHRARHAAGLKEMVSTCAVEEMARWLERADPPRSERATPALPVVRAIAWHLRVGGSWRALPCGFPAWRTVYGWFRKWLDLGLFDRLLCDVARLRRRSGGRRAEPRLGIIDTQSVKCIPVRGSRGFDAAKKVLGRKRVALVDADGTWLAIAVVPASVQERDTLAALDAGKAAWPSLREVILDGAFTAERCREWSNLHGMRHRVVERDPEQKGFVVLAGRWVVERSFGWLVHWGGLLRDRAGRLDVSAARIAFAAVLSGVEALLNPMPIQAAVS